MVVDLFFCATLTGRTGGHTPFVFTGAGMSSTGAEAVKLDQGSSRQDHSRMGDGDESTESRGVVQPLSIPSVTA